MPSLPPIPIISYFNPRPPRGGRLALYDGVTSPLQFQSTPPARGATPLTYDAFCEVYISIHAPREGGDCAILPP